MISKDSQTDRRRETDRQTVKYRHTDWQVRKQTGTSPHDDRPKCRGDCKEMKSLPLFEEMPVSIKHWLVIFGEILQTTKSLNYSTVRSQWRGSYSREIFVLSDNRSFAIDMIYTRSCNGFQRNPLTPYIIQTFRLTHEIKTTVSAFSSESNSPSTGFPVFHGNRRRKKERDYAIYSV